ncbi:MAG: transglutaminase family protein [Lachnospiraceae bacterium]
MKNLHFDYAMEIEYSEDVNICYYTIKCIPMDNERQKISNLSIEMIPDAKPEWANDSHGNRYIYGCNDMPHNYFKFHIWGDAECGKADYDAVATENEEMLFRHSAKLTCPGEHMKAYHEKILFSLENNGPSSENNGSSLENNGFSLENITGMTPLEKAIFFMDRLQENFIYEKGCTDVKTSAEEAIQIGKGVCQDYSHILISLLLLEGCSARYVTGFIEGEGATHAWVEVLQDGKWYGVDPTNHTVVKDAHIKIGVGRDATECQINRGTMHGGGTQTQKVSVCVTEKSMGQHYLRKRL